VDDDRPLRLGLSRPGAASLFRMDDKVNLAEKIGLLDKPYSPGIVGYLNDYKLVVVRVRGRVRLAQT
jgi:hypothetical protein